MWNVSRIDRKFIDIESRDLQWNEFTRQALGVAGCTIPWVCALMFFVPQGADTDHHALWAIAAMLIAGSAAAMASAPVAIVVFDLVVGAAGVASFILTGDFLFAIAAAAYTVTIFAGALRSARTYLSARIAEAGVAEKDEVVSLLLREFEEKESDWLWQVDTNRRIRSASPRFAFAVGCAPEDIEGESFIKLIAGSSWESGEFPRSLHELAEKLKKREHFSNLLVQVHLKTGRSW